MTEYLDLLSSTLAITFTLGGIDLSLGAVTFAFLIYKAGIYYFKYVSSEKKHRASAWSWVFDDSLDKNIRVNDYSGKWVDRHGKEY